jgi:hypothetical protein
MKLGSINPLSNVPGFSTVANAIRTIKDLLEISETNITGFNFGRVTVTKSGCGMCPNGKHVSTYKVEVNIPKNDIILTPLQYSYSKGVNIPFLAGGGVKLYVAVKSHVEIKEIKGEIYFAICDGSVRSVNGSPSSVLGGATLHANLFVLAEAAGQVLNRYTFLILEGDAYAKGTFDMTVLDHPNGVHLHVTGGYKFVTTMSVTFNDSQAFSFKYNLDKKSDTYCIQILK